MLGDLRKMFFHKLDALLLERAEAMEKAVRSGELGLAREHLGAKDNLALMRETFDDAMRDFDADPLDDEAEDDDKT